MSQRFALPFIKISQQSPAAPREVLPTPLAMSDAASGQARGGREHTPEIARGIARDQRYDGKMTCKPCMAQAVLRRTHISSV